MGYIKKLKNNELVGGTDKTTIYPVTSTEAVFEEVGENNFKSQKYLNNHITGNRIESNTITGDKLVNKAVTEEKVSDALMDKINSAAHGVTEEFETEVREALKKVVNTVSVNNDTPLQPDVNKNINITVPEGLADLNGDSNHRTVTDAEKSTWSGKQDALTFDNVPTANSNNPVKSGGVYQAIQNIDVSSQISGKADKSEMSVVAGTGANADKTTITLKSGTSAAVLTQHQDVSGKEDKNNKVTSFSSPTDTQYPSAKLVNDQLATKQGIISDLSTIRSGASAGATAYQKPGTGIPPTDFASAVQTSLGKADTAIQSVTVGTTTTGAAGSSASVTNTGTATEPVLSFTIPQGAQGIQGIQGPQGERGPQGNTGVQVDSVASIIHSIDPTATYAAADVAGADAVQDVLEEVTELGEKLNGVEFEEKDVTFFSGQALEITYGSATGGANAKRTDYINIGKLEEGDVIVWSGTVKNNVLAMYDSDYKFCTAYSATGSTRTITVPSTVAALNVVYIRITFSASGTPVFTINGKNILENVDYSLALDDTLSQHLPAEGETVGVRMTNVESAINDFTTTSQGVPTLKSGYYINTQGEEVADTSWSCTDYVQIPTLSAGDIIYWGGTKANTSGGLAFYDSHKRLIGYYNASASSRTIDLTSASTVVCDEAKYIRVSFSGTPVFTINGTDLFVKYNVATDSTMTLDMPANAKGVGEYVRGIMGVSVFRDGYYINTDGNETESSSWFYAIYRLNEAIKAGDVFVWSGITNLLDATISFYRSDGTHVGGWSANGNSRTFTIGDSSPAIGTTIIKASFLLSKKDIASVSINGVVQEFSIIKEDKSVAEYNADKQPMVVSLSRTKLDVSTLKKYFCFAQITDTHGENDLVQRAVDFANSEEFGSIDCLVHTGDIQKTSFTDGDMPAYHNAMDNSVKPAFTVIGNHDVWNRTSNANLYNRYMKPMVDEGLLVAGTNIDATNYATWYYYDFTEYSIRLIALNDFDPLWDGWSVGSSVMNTTVYSPAQIDFLISTLQSVPSGYTVIIVDHYPSNKGTGYSGTTINPDWTMGVSPIGGGHSSLFTDHQSPMIDILSSYKSKTSLVQSYTYSNSSVASYYGSIDVNVDFTSANGTFAFMACGHSHNDEVYKFADKNDIIAIDMLGGVNPTIIDSPTKILRTYSGKAHDAINVYCVRTDERKVYVIRIGADFRADGKEQVITSFEY